MYTRQQLCNYCTGNGTPFARTNLMQDRWANCLKIDFCIEQVFKLTSVRYH